MKYVHDANLTCYAQAGAFNINHFQIERYTYPFTGPEGKVKESVRYAVKEALEARTARGVLGGRLHVELDEDSPGSGRVVDHVPRWSNEKAEPQQLEPDKQTEKKSGK